MTGADFVRDDAHAPQAGNGSRHAAQARSAGRSQKPRNLEKSVTEK